MPIGTGTPYGWNSSLPWYSWIFTLGSQLQRFDQALDGVGRVVEQLLLVIVELQLDDLLDALGSEHAGHADEEIW